jgi:hypothetical protein
LQARDVLFRDELRRALQVCIALCSVCLSLDEADETFDLFVEETQVIGAES